MVALFTQISKEEVSPASEHLRQKHKDLSSEKTLGYQMIWKNGNIESEKKIFTSINWSRTPSLFFYKRLINSAKIKYFMGNIRTYKKTVTLL